MGKMTNQENFRAEKITVIEKINALPNTITVIVNWEDVTLDITEAKTEAIDAIRRIDTFTPALTPVDNIRFGLHRVSENAKTAFNHAVWEG
jgi:hypothetical protein